MQSLKAEHWVNATMEQHPPPGHGTPQHRSHVPFRERCKTSREECSSTILPALAVNKYGLRILLGAGKTQGGKKKQTVSFLEFSRESNKAAAPHRSGFQVVPPHGGGSAGHGTQGRKHLALAQLGTAGFSPPAQVAGSGFCPGFCDTKHGTAHRGREAPTQTQAPQAEAARR